MAAFRQVHDHFAVRGAGPRSWLDMKARHLVHVLACDHQAQVHRRACQRFGDEVRSKRDHRHRSRDACVSVAMHGGVGEARRDDTARRPDFQGIESVAAQLCEEPDTGRKILLDVPVAMRLEALIGPLPPGQRQRGMPARRTAEDADGIQRELPRECRMLRDTIDRLRDFVWPLAPAHRTGIGGVEVVVRVMQGDCHCEAATHQRTRQVHVHPGRAARAVRDDDQSPVAFDRRAVRHPRQSERPLPDGNFCPRRGVEHRRRSPIGLRQLHEAHARAFCGLLRVGGQGCNRT